MHFKADIFEGHKKIEKFLMLVLQYQCENINVKIHHFFSL